MREVLSFLFDRLIDPLGLPISPVWEYLALLVIGFVAYVFAYRAVGDLYNSGDISTRVGGSILHWIIRFIFFIIVWAITYAIIALIKFITAHWVIVVSILGGLIAIAFVIAIVLVLRKKGRDKK